jgi:hypothetical protein
MQEIWRGIDGFEGSYQVSNYGRIRSLERWVSNGRGFRKIGERILKPHLSTDDRYVVRFYDRRKSKQVVRQIHRLVAQAFIPKPKGKNVVNHLDLDPHNNHVSNLEWTDHSGNTQHAFAHGANKQGEEHHFAKLTKEDVMFIRKHYTPRDKDLGRASLARKYGVHPVTISKIVRYQKWKYLI